jgi:hypothetical protein
MVGIDVAQPSLRFQLEQGAAQRLEVAALPRLDLAAPRCGNACISSKQGDPRLVGAVSVACLTSICSKTALRILDGPRA